MLFESPMRPLRFTPVLRASVLAAGVLLAALTADTPRAAAQTLEEAAPLLQSGERDEVEAGIQMLGLLGTADAVAPLLARIGEGLPPDLLEVAIITLGAIGDPSATETLAMLARHRRPEVRSGALSALAVVGGEGAYNALIGGLSDGEDSVRTAAATGLGDLGHPEATPVLFRALDRGNPAASMAIGKLTPSADAPRLLTYVGKLPFYHLSPALLELLKRSDVKEPAKLNVVAKVAELGTPEARRFLTDAVAASGKDLGQRVSRAALRAAQEISE